MMDLISRYVDRTHRFWSLPSDLAQNTPPVPHLCGWV